MSQFLTGHGAFRASLHRFALRDSPACTCGFETQDMAHVLFDCREHSDARRVLVECMRLFSRVESRDDLEHGIFGYRILVESGPLFDAFKAMPKAYRTCSTDALPVLAGLLPVDLAIVEWAANFELARFRNFDAGTLHFEYVVDEPLATRKKRINEIVCAHWQSRWVSPTSKGETTRLFFPNVSERLEKNWLISDYYTSQFQTGHGAFRASLHRFALRDSPACTCGFETQDMAHVLFDCREHSYARRVLIECIRLFSKVESRGDLELGFLGYRILVESGPIFDAFKAFAKCVIENLEDLNAALSRYRDQP